MRICVVTNRVQNAKISFSLVSRLLKGKRDKVTVFHFTTSGSNTLKSIEEAADEILTDETVRKNITFERLESLQPSFLVKLTDKDRPDFLVVNKRDFAHGSLLGKTWKISQLIHSISIPTFVVARKVKTLSHFLVGLTKSESDQEIRVVTELAHSLNAKVSLLYVIPDSPKMYYGLTRMQETASTFLKTRTVPARMVKQDLEYLIKNKVNGTLLLRHGEDMVGELIAERAERKYDLIVLSCQHEALMSRLLDGHDIPIDIMKNVKDPLLIIPEVRG